jgi:hypothetical protein
MRGYTVVKHFKSAPGGYVKSDGTHVDIYEWYTVELYQQPFWQWLVATVYHWYDMRVGKVPGFRRLEGLLQKGKDPFEHISLGCRQDLRCYRLSNAKRVVLATFKVKEDSDIVKACWPEKKGD